MKDDVVRYDVLADLVGPDGEVPGLSEWLRRKNFVGKNVRIVVEELKPYEGIQWEEIEDRYALATLDLMLGGADDADSTDDSAGNGSGALKSKLSNGEVKRLQTGLLLSFVARNLFWKVYEDKQELWPDWETDPLWRIEDSYQVANEMLHFFIPSRSLEDYSQLELMNVVQSFTEEMTDWAEVKLANRLKKGVANGTLAVEDKELIHQIAVQEEANKVFLTLKDEVFTKGFVDKYGYFPD